MRLRLGALLGALALMSGSARADMFGGDVLVLSQLLANAMEQLIQLKQVVSAGEDTLEMMRDVNQGLNEALGLARTLPQGLYPKLFRDIRSAESALRMMNDVYGQAVESKDQGAQNNADQAAAEAIALNNDLFQYAGATDDIGDAIKKRAQVASPKGAERLTAESMGSVLQTMNQSLRSQAMGLKLQAEQIATQNRKDKAFSAQVKGQAAALGDSMSGSKPKFSLPRF